MCVLYRCWYDTYRLNVFWRLGSWAALLKTSPDPKRSHSTAEQPSRSRKPLDRWSISEGSEGTHNRHIRSTQKLSRVATQTERSCATTWRTFISTNLDVLYKITLSACMKTCFLVSHITATITLYVLWHGSLKQPCYHHYTTLRFPLTITYHAACFQEYNTEAFSCELVTQHIVMLVA